MTTATSRPSSSSWHTRKASTSKREDSPALVQRIRSRTSPSPSTLRCVATSVASASREQLRRLDPRRQVTAHSAHAAAVIHDDRRRRQRLEPLPVARIEGLAQLFEHPNDGGAGRAALTLAVQTIELGVRGIQFIGVVCHHQRATAVVVDFGHLKPLDLTFTTERELASEHQSGQGQSIAPSFENRRRAGERLDLHDHAEKGQIRLAVRVVLKETAMADRSEFRRQQALGQIEVAGLDRVANLSEDSDCRVLTESDSDSVSSRTARRARLSRRRLSARSKITIAVSRPSALLSATQ